MISMLDHTCCKEVVQCTSSASNSRCLQISEKLNADDVPCSLITGKLQHHAFLPHKLILAERSAGRGIMQYNESSVCDVLVLLINNSERAWLLLRIS